MSRKKHVKDKVEKAPTEDEEKNPDDYQCTGNVEIDFPGLCALLDIKDIPAVVTKQPASSTAYTDGEDANYSESQTSESSPWYKPCLHVELESEDPLSAKSIKAFGLTIDELISRALQKILPSLIHLQVLQFWKARLTDQMGMSLMNTISLCSHLRVVMLEGNTLPEQTFHYLLSEDSVLTHLSLRNTRLGDNGARLIGSALSTTKSSNKNLVSLNLAFNSIGDAGAAHIAQGLRFNRVLLFLSLSNNLIGDTGAAQLAEILCDFALTHEEIVERRKMLLKRAHGSGPNADSDQASADHLSPVTSNTSLSVHKDEKKSSPHKKEAHKKDEKSAAHKDHHKSHKKASTAKTHHGKGGKPGDKLHSQEVQSHAAQSEMELLEIGNPLLVQTLHYRDGQLIMPGNTILSSLNLAGNRITEKTLPLFLASLELQGEGKGLMRLCLQRNRFPAECESKVKIDEVIALRHQANNNPKETEEEGHAATC